MYFPTLVEVPIAKMFLSLGMHPGPLIAYLMADPELSLQSILITAAIIGKLRAWTYVGLVARFSRELRRAHRGRAALDRNPPQGGRKECTMLINILGTGRAKCNRLEQLTREAVAALGIDARFEHVKEMDRIMAYPIMTTPALVIDEEVKVSGRIPAREELLAWLSGR